MLGMVFAHLIETMVRSVSESYRISITIQCSARKSKWAPKWASFRIVSEFGKLRIPAVTASLRVKLALFKLSLAVRYSVCKGSSTTVRKTVRFFGLLKTRKVGLRLRGCLRKLNGKTFHEANTDTDGTILGEDVQRRKLVEPEQAERQKSPQKVFLGNWCMLSHFASERNRWATVCQVGVVLLTLMLPRQLGVARAVWSAAFTVTVSVVIALVLSFLGVKNKLSTEIWKLWEEAASLGEVTVSPEVMRSIVETFSRSKLSSRLLCGTAALLVVVLFQLSPSSWGQQL